MGLGGMEALDGCKRSKGCEGEQVAIGDGISWKTPCKRRRSRAQLGDSVARVKSLGSVVA